MGRIKIMLFIACFLLLAGCTYDAAETEAATPAVQAAEKSPAKHQKIKTEQKEEKMPLEGLTICIDAGHGTTTRAKGLKEPIAPGSKIMKAAFATGTTGVATKITEASLNLTVSKKLKKALTEQGAEIVMIRETAKCDLSNVERAKLWNKSGADFTIRIHANGASDSKIAGILMMVPSNKYINDSNLLDTSFNLGQAVLKNVIRQTKAKSKGTVKTSELTGFNWSSIPVILIEMGFMTNPEEDKQLNTDTYQNKIVTGMIEGILSFYHREAEDKQGS